MITQKMVRQIIAKNKHSNNNFSVTSKDEDAIQCALHEMGKPGKYGASVSDIVQNAKIILTLWNTTGK